MTQQEWQALEQSLDRWLVNVKDLLGFVAEALRSPVIPKLTSVHQREVV